MIFGANELRVVASIIEWANENDGQTGTPIVERIELTDDESASSGAIVRHGYKDYVLETD